jgi:hypothetical protein
MRKPRCYQLPGLLGCGIVGQLIVTSDNRFDNLAHIAGFLPKRSITSAQLWTQLGLDHGLSVDLPLTHTGLTALQLAEPQSEIEGAQEPQPISNPSRQFEQHDLGLQAGLRQLTTHGICRQCAAQQPDLPPQELGLAIFGLTFAFKPYHLSEDASQAHLGAGRRRISDKARNFAAGATRWR